MDSRRLVVWIAAGILGFQGGTLVLDIIHCSVLSWLYVRRHGLAVVAPQPALQEQRPPSAEPQPMGEPGQASDLAMTPGAAVETVDPPVSAPAPPSSPTRPEASRSTTVLDPTEVFCNRPRGRVDAAVGQGLSILAGLALGGQGVGGGRGGGP